MNLFAFIASVYCISHRPADYRKAQTFYVAYGAILFALVTIQIASSSLLCQFMWIDYRNHPGGPLGYYGASQGAWYNVLSFAAPAMANILGDGLLVRPRGVARAGSRKADIIVEPDRYTDAS
jgi:hypothetical protein